MEKITMEDILKTATMSIFHEHMKEAVELARKISDLMMDHHLTACMIAIAMAKGAVLGALDEQDVERIKHIKQLMENITNHYEKAMREEIKKEGE